LDEAKQDKKKRKRARDLQRKIIKHLGSFIKYNQVLQHLDLSHTGLNEEAIKKIGICLNKSRALISFHLTGNPGISPHIAAMLAARIKCKEEVKVPAQINFGVGNSKLNDARMSKKRELISENLKIQHIKQSVDINKNEVKLRGQQLDLPKVLNFRRFLGHRFDMPGSA